MLNTATSPLVGSAAYTVALDASTARPVAPFEVSEAEGFEGRTAAEAIGCVVVDVCTVNDDVEIVGRTIKAESGVGTTAFEERSSSFLQGCRQERIHLSSRCIDRWIEFHVEAYWCRRTVIRD